MIFIIPLILGAAAVVTSAIGIVAGAKGMSKMEQAKEIREAAKKRYEDKKAQVESKAKEIIAAAKKRYKNKTAQIKSIEKETNKIINEYNNLQEQLKQETVKRFIYLFAQIKEKLSAKEVKEIEEFFLRDFKCTPLPAISCDESVRDVRDNLAGANNNNNKNNNEKIKYNYNNNVGKAVVWGVMGGIVARAATWFAGRYWGTASTGTAIRLLSGAAARRAALAWLGGGSLAAGGGGMALGSLLLNGITIGPALMTGGWQMSKKGEEALAQATKYEAEVNQAIATIEKEALAQATKYEAEVNQAIATIENGEDFLKTFIQWWLNKLKELLLELNSLTKEALDDLETALSGFDPQRDAYKFQKAAALSKTLIEFTTIGMPAVNSKGKAQPDVLAEKIVSMVMLYFSMFGLEIFNLRRSDVFLNLQENCLPDDYKV